jgi:hypothetical protein
MPNDKKLSQVNLLRLLSVKTVGDDLPVVREKHRLILTGKPASPEVPPGQIDPEFPKSLGPKPSLAL